MVISLDKNWHGLSAFSHVYLLACLLGWLDDRLFVSQIEIGIHTHRPKQKEENSTNIKLLGCARYQGQTHTHTHAQLEIERETGRQTHTIVQVIVAELQYHSYRM